MAERTHFEVADASSVVAATDTAVCVGASHAFVDALAMLQALRGVATAAAVVGDGVWMAEPSAAGAKVSATSAPPLQLPSPAPGGPSTRAIGVSLGSAGCTSSLALPVIFIQEVHRPDLVDFGRELDGSEDVHCLEDNPNTAIAAEQTGFLPTDYHIRKRRYSAFFGTDFEILLRGLDVDTLLLCGGLTDVCVHYTFVDGHQSDYFCRVIEDCVAGSTEQAHEYSLQAMEYLQTGARRSLDEVLSAMDAHTALSAKSTA